MMFTVGLCITVILAVLWLKPEFWRLWKEFFAPILSGLRSLWGRLTGFFSRKEWIYVLVALLLFGIGYWLGHGNKETEVVTETVTERVEIPVEVPVYVKGDTVVEYIEKESPNDADVEWYSSPSKVVMSFNDEKYEMDALPTETHKFDKGKLEVQQESAVTLDVTPIVEREVKIAEEETRKQVEEELNEEFQKELKTKRREARQDGFWAGLGTALIVGAGVALSK